MDAFLIVLIILIVAGRLLWIGEYFLQYWLHHRTFKEVFSKTRVQVNHPGIGKDLAQEKHEYYIQRAERSFDLCLLGGALGVTGWSALYGASVSRESDISALSLGFLFLGVFVLISGPIVARVEELFFNYMVRESAVRVGFGAIVLSLSSVAWDLTGASWGVITTIVAVLVAAGDLKQDWALVGRLKRIIPSMPKSRRCRCDCCVHSTAWFRKLWQRSAVQSEAQGVRRQRAAYRGAGRRPVKGFTTSNPAHPASSPGRARSLFQNGA